MYLGMVLYFEKVWLVLKKYGYCLKGMNRANLTREI
jgi:hypothetical protein